MQKEQSITPTQDDCRIVLETKKAFIAGAFDAVGNITVEIRKEGDYTVGYSLIPVLKMSSSDKDSPLLEFVEEYCESYDVQYSRYEKSGSKRGAIIEIRNTESVENFLTPIRKRLLQNRNDAEIMLSEIVPAVRDGKHRTERGFYDLMWSVDKIRERKIEQGNIKYTKEFFRKEFSLSE